MDAEELANHVDELELRLERLRVLYDQYFMGIEKVPPNVPQKDVDRRIWILRREKIRNTGVRFKFQTIVQRYSTFSSYWQRILREIENGTYKRHVQRAKRRFGEDALAPSARPDERAPARDEAFELDADALEAETFDVDLDLDDVALPPVGDDLGVPSAPPAARDSRPMLSPLGTMRAAPKDAPLPSAPAPSAGAPTTGAPTAAARAAPVAAPAAPPTGARPPGPPPRAPVPPPEAVRPPTPAATVSSTAPTTPTANARPGAALPATAPPSPSDRVATTSDPLRAPGPAAATATTKPAAAAAPATRPSPSRPATATAHESVPRILAAKVRTDDDLDAMLDDALGGPTAAPRAASPGPGPERPAAAARPAPMVVPKPTAPAPPAPVAVRPAAAAPPAAARPATAARPQPAAPAPAGGGDFRAVYARYVESRRSNGESTAGLTYESLAKNLRDTTEKLKSKSGGKPIDFEVVVKDGKTILKPVVK